MKTDARMRFTRMQIRAAFLQCLKEKPVSRIPRHGAVCHGGELAKQTNRLCAAVMAAHAK